MVGTVEVKRSDPYAERSFHLATDNDKLRAGISAILQVAAERPHWTMKDGTTVHNFCRSLLSGTRT